MKSCLEAGQFNPCYFALQQISRHAIGLEVFLGSEDGRQCLIIALEKRAPFDLIRQLVSTSPELTTALLQARNGKKCTALHVAIMSKYEPEAETVQLLVDRGADLQAVNMYGHTPLHSAIWTRSNSMLQVVDILVSHGADCNASRNKSALYTALGDAVLIKAPLALIRLLVERGNARFCAQTSEEACTLLGDAIRSARWGSREQSLASTALLDYLLCHTNLGRFTHVIKHTESGIVLLSQTPFRSKLERAHNAQVFLALRSACLKPRAGDKTSAMGRLPQELIRQVYSFLYNTTPCDI